MDESSGNVTAFEVTLRYMSIYAFARFIVETVEVMPFTVEQYE
jgi:hypothetical protein